MNKEEMKNLNQAFIQAGASLGWKLDEVQKAFNELGKVLSESPILNAKFFLCSRTAQKVGIMIKK